ncbi:MAG TPA: DUF3152 domain-containing protein [Actinomycetota bacterium]|nr:DUF3152 domain-containing protein [Actinomycetota bacterium]
MVEVHRTVFLLALAATLTIAPGAIAQTETPSPVPSPTQVPPDTTPPAITIGTRDARVVLGTLDKLAAIRASFSEPSSVTIRVTSRSGRRIVQVPIAERAVSRVAAKWAGGGVRGRLVRPGRYSFVVRARDAAGNGSVKRVPVRAVASSYAGAAPLHYTYVLEGRGVPRSAMRDFATVAAETLADMKGWSLRHNVSYRRVASGGNFRLILASPGSVAAASPACSSYWSCRVGSQVLINLDRWRYATPSWDQPRREYRSFVINHEVGHWLGLGHAGCGGTGRPAPVMMQQSKGLYGCRHNAWPLESERARVAALRGGTAWPLMPLASPCTIVGTGRRDVLRGTGRPDVVCGLGGDDVLHGLGGDDVLVGGGGRDELRGGPGSDRARGPHDRCTSCGVHRRQLAEPVAPPVRRVRVDVE